MRAAFLFVLPFMTLTVRGAEDVSALLGPILAKHETPALAAAAVRDGKIVALGAAGVRKLGGSERVTVDDRWHIGSCGKAMTATLAAILVEAGTIRWEATVADVFPEWRGRMDAGWEKVTLEQLLTNRAGAAEQPPANAWKEAWEQKGSPVQQRLRFLTAIVKTAPVAEPGTAYLYSNQGFALAGAMLEKAGGAPWEKLMETKLFKPLEMQGAGFGAPGTAGRKANQPWGHAAKGAGLEPVPPGARADNPPAIGPAGTMHFSISDFARFAAWHAAEGGIPPALLKPETFNKLHTPPEGGDYAFGWAVKERKWAGGRTLTHAGSNTMWYAVVWIAPEKNAAFVAVTNSGSEKAAAACDDAVFLLVHRILEG